MSFDREKKELSFDTYFRLKRFQDGRIGSRSYRTDHDHQANETFNFERRSISWINAPPSFSFLTLAFSILYSFEKFSFVIIVFSRFQFSKFYFLEILFLDIIVSDIFSSRLFFRCLVIIPDF